MGLRQVGSLEEHPDGVQVRFERAAQRRFGLVIGADGLHSHIRALAFGPHERFEKPLGYFVAAFEVAGYRPRDESVYVLFSRPGKMAGRIALHDDRTLFLFVFAAENRPVPRRLDLAGKKAILRERFREEGWECQRILAALDEQQELYFDSVSQVRLDRWSRGRVALVGDAAFSVSLTGGQGSALAMAAAYILAGEIADAAGEPQRAFLRYEEQLRRFITSKQRAAERFAAAFAPRTSWGLMLRNLSINLARRPGLARLAIGRGIMDSLTLPNYPALRSPSSGST